MSIKTVGELINELQKFDENQEVELFSVTRNFAVNDYSGSYITRVEARDEIVKIFNEDFPIYHPFRDAEECFTEMREHEPFGWVVSKDRPKSYFLVTAQENGVCFSDSNGFMPYTYMLRFYKFADGEPFGKHETINPRY